MQVKINHTGMEFRLEKWLKESYRNYWSNVKSSAAQENVRNKNLEIGRTKNPKNNRRGK